MYFIVKEVSHELLYSTKYLVFWVIIIVFGFIYGIVVNSVTRVYTIVITPSEVQLVIKGIFWPLHKEKIALHDIKNLVKYQITLGKYDLEFITDRGRFKLRASLTLDAVRN